MRSCCSVWRLASDDPTHATTRPLDRGAAGCSIAPSAASWRSPAPTRRRSSRARSPTTSRRSRPGSGCYAAFLTPKGKMLGDLRILDTGDELLLDTERVALQELFNMIRRFCIGYDVELHKRTLECGPALPRRPVADEVVERAFGGPPAERARARRGARAIGSADGPGDPDRRRDRPAVRRRRRRRRCAAALERAGAGRSPRPRSSACGSSVAGRATASTSTTA